MNTKNVEFSISNEIPGLTSRLNTFSIEEHLQEKWLNWMSRVNSEDLGEWTLIFYFVLRATNGVGIFKKNRRYPSDKKIELPISISIPTPDDASYGAIEAKQAFFHPMNEKEFHLLDIPYSRFNNLMDYIYFSCEASVERSLIQKITINGKKIGFNN